MSDVVRAIAGKFVETLEPRKLLSAALEGTQLVVTGTAGNDTINVFLAAPGSTQVSVKVNNNTQTFDLAAIREIKVFGLRGDDLIQINQTNGVIPRETKLFGGAGDDSIVGGSARDKIHGDEGDDVVQGGGNKDQIFGDIGDDSIIG